MFSPARRSASAHSIAYDQSSAWRYLDDPGVGAFANLPDVRVGLGRRPRPAWDAGGGEVVRR